MKLSDIGEDILLSEYKRRVEKIKSEEELEQIRLDEIKELKKKVFVEYEGKKEELENQNKLIEKKTIQYNRLISDLRELEESKKQKQNFIVQLDDGTFEIVGKEDVEIVSDEEIIKNVNKSNGLV